MGRYTNNTNAGGPYTNRILRVISEVTSTVDGQQVVVEPVTLAEAKNYLRVTVDTVDDALITEMIKAARAIAENYISRDIIQRQREMYVDYQPDYQLELLNSPIASVDSVVIMGVTQTEGTGYQLIGISDDPILEFNELGIRELSVTFTTAGMLNDPSIKQGILSILHGLYDNGTAGDMYKSILAPHKVLFI